jgi:uncharacterized protein (TIGR02588 family)
MNDASTTERRAGQIEWVVAVLSAILVLAMLLYLTAHAIRGTDALPDLSVTRLAGPSDQLRFAVRNDGARAAQSVTVALRLGDDEVRRTVIEFVAANSEVQGAFLLDGSDPSAELVVESYLDP